MTHIERVNNNGDVLACKYPLIKSNIKSLFTTFQWPCLSLTTFGLPKVFQWQAMDFSRSIKTVSKTDFYIQARNDSRKTWKVNMKKRSCRNYFSDFLYAARLFRRINAKVIQAEVLIYLSFWFDLYIIKILLVQDMAMKSKMSMIMTLDNPFLCLISFNGWRGHAYSGLKYTQVIPAQSSTQSIVSVGPVIIQNSYCPYPL